MSTHTPGPWKARTFRDEKARFIAQTGDYLPHIECISYGERSEQDAAFIVRACNAHEELVQTLRKARAALYNVPEVGEKYDQQHSHTHAQACLDIDEALRLAEGRSA